MLIFQVFDGRLDAGLPFHPPTCFVAFTLLQSRPFFGPCLKVVNLHTHSIYADALGDFFVLINYLYNGKSIAGNKYPQRADTLCAHLKHLNQKIELLT